MKLDSRSRVLVTGIGGFTGRHLASHLVNHDFEVVGLTCDLIDRDAVFEEVAAFRPHYVVHLAGISFAVESNADLIYQINVIGTVNLLDALCQLTSPPKKVILASSATIYGNVSSCVLNEGLCPKPLSHYGCSKLAMEHMAQNYINKFPLLITRPFNYTGAGHAEYFLIPKIVKAYQEGMAEIELGNLDVSREFNDVRDVCEIYLKLLLTATDDTVVNICSGKTIRLMNIISMMNQISGREMKVRVNPKFVRENEIKDLSGDVSKLQTFIQPEFQYSIEDTLAWMYGSKDD